MKWTELGRILEVIGAKIAAVRGGGVSPAPSP